MQEVEKRTSVHKEINLSVCDLFKFQEMVYSEAVDLMFVWETWRSTAIFPTKKFFLMDMIYIELIDLWDELGEVYW
jgi:hypothetical protein